MYQLNTLSLRDEQAVAWDNFVTASDEATFFHLSGWQQIIADAGHRCYYLYASENNQIVGVLPLARVKSMLFGDALVSTPFCVYGGAVGEPAVKRFLEQEAVKLANSLQVKHIELRYKTAQDNDFTTRSQHAYFACELAETAEQILANVKKKQRAVIRHALNEPLHYTLDTNPNDFYQTYSESVRNLGTPVFSKAFFQKIMQVFPAQTEILTVRKEQQAVSSVLSFYYKGEVLPYYGGGISEAKSLKSNDYMYYQLMCHARLDKNCQRYDFGRSKLESGAYQYKKHWGMAATELHYQYKLITAQQLPNLSPNNPKYQLFIRLWQKLPLPVSQWLGPALSRYLG
ncbi:FemAB-related protein (PEP-CTERM system-associated) [Rheinheimera pacifica]|uniref:FemAB family XrtA/PEP-CTERM system-associated protein n=1 Tax=Rheinheimera pacifica TaxID=173990 RepID=UPI0021677290|nr:FemAB family XrtA/PEP-CTERM system-associated protein [Rheinheimera pacifica]MCS4307449.1 FemAB-related protein (PEP-CTERM system-associated) [Rheinheimera pacifica]